MPANVLEIRERVRAFTEDKMEREGARMGKTAWRGGTTRAASGGWDMR
jgi:hypothetical protein